MTVQDLIDKLKMYSPELKVLTKKESDYFTWKDGAILTVIKAKVDTNGIYHQTAGGNECLSIG